jgi:hypothetical protein
MQPTNLSAQQTQHSAMKRLAAVVLLVVITGVVLCVEYEMAVWLGVRLLLIAGCGVAFIAVALSRAPVASDNRGVFCICRSARPVTQFPQHRFSQLARVRL